MTGEGRSNHRPAVWSICTVLLLILGVGASWPAQSVIAQEDDATPAASPATMTPEEARFARLGGSLADVITEYGSPDWTDPGLVGYNALSLGGIDTITMVYFDAQERVRSYLLVYLEQPEELRDAVGVANVVADVAPRDGDCDDEPLEDSNLSGDVYGCASKSLLGVFSPDELLAFDVIGEDGTYSFSVNPTDDDQFFEIAVRLGTDGPPEPATPVPTPSPVPPSPLDTRYPPLDDAAELIDGSIDQGAALSVTGTVLEVRPAESGTTLILDVAAEDGSSIVVAAENQDDLAGVFPGEVWTVYGVFAGYECDDAGNCTATIYVMALG